MSRNMARSEHLFLRNRCDQLSCIHLEREIVLSLLREGDFGPRSESGDTSRRNRAGIIETRKRTRSCDLGSI